MTTPPTILKSPGRLPEAEPTPRNRGHLEAILCPRSVAVIGATETPGAVGRAVLENLATFGGPIYPVNPKRPAVLGRPAYPNVGAIGEEIDLAVIVTPAATVPEIVRQCAAAGVGGAVILSAGFKECGATGAALETQLLAEARQSRMRIVGPNCLGVMMPHLSLNATFAAGQARPGKVAFLSQSGALCTAILDWSFRENVGFSAFVSLGSMLDVGWGDLITCLGDDPRTKSIVCYMESVGDARSFLSSAREVALSKPIIVLKVGHTEAGARAAASHTGALTGSDAVLDAALRRAGVLRVNTIEELFDMAEVLSKQPRPRGPRLAIVTNAGGPGALAADALVASGGRIATLSPSTINALSSLLPGPWSHGNPIDLLGNATPAQYARAVELAANSDGTDGTLVILTPQAMTDTQGTAEALRPFANLEGKPILASWMGGATVEAGKVLLNTAGIPTFDYPDTAARAFALMWRHSDSVRTLYETPGSSAATERSAATRENASRLIQAARRAGRTLLTEVESKQLLGAYGIPAVETHPALTEQAAAKWAAKLGFPVVLKVFSESVTHKSDVGGVQLNLRNATAVRQAWRQIRASVQAQAGAGHFAGVTVQPMIKGEGCELILGSSIDPQFGPVLLFGAGGRLVEVFKDTVLGLPPLNATLARRLMEQARIFGALQGGRGRKAVNLETLADLLVHFSELVVEQPWIAEIDINPLLASGEQILALDARVVLHPPETPESRLPRPAIRPYPARYILPLHLRDGTRVTLRPIRPEDEPLLVKFHQTLSDRSVYFRYFAPLRLDQRIAHERLSRICFIDYDRELALVVERHDATSGQPEILGVGRLNKLHGANEAEFALTVSDRWQGHGLGTHLLRTLVQAGRDEKLDRITATIMAENHEMLHVARKVGFVVQQVPGTSEYRAEINL